MTRSRVFSTALVIGCTLLLSATQNVVAGEPVKEIQICQNARLLASSEADTQVEIQLVDARMDAKHCYDIRLGCMHSARGDEPQRHHCQSDFNACMRVIGKFSCDRGRTRDCGVERQYCVANARNDDQRLRHCEEDFGACIRSSGCR